VAHPASCPTSMVTEASLPGDKAAEAWIWSFRSTLAKNAWSYISIPPSHTRTTLPYHHITYHCNLSRYRHESAKGERNISPTHSLPRYCHMLEVESP
jgi:hypothetical protein